MLRAAAFDIRCDRIQCDRCKTERITLAVFQDNGLFRMQGTTDIATLARILALLAACVLNGVLAASAQATDSTNGGQGGARTGSWVDITDFFQGNGPLRGYKGQFYEGGLRVPLIVRWPGKVRPGTISDQICGFWDMLPTLAEIAGAAPPMDIDGVSIVSTLLGRGRQPQHIAIYWEYPRREGGIARAARMG